MTGGLLTLFFSLLLLAILAAVGHGMWLAARAVFRLLSGGNGPPRPSDALLCPLCGRPVRSFDTRCEACGFQFGRRPEPPQPPGGSLERDLDATERQLKRFAQSGAIPDEQLAVVFEQIRQEQRRLRLAQLGSAAKSAPTRPQPETPATNASEETYRIAADEPGASQTGRDETAADAETTSDSTFPIHAWVPPRPAGTAAAEEHETSADFAADNAGIHVDSPPAGQHTSPPSRGRRRLVRGILQAFSEERNIHWGEWISGLLIIGSAVGLVISLWATLKQDIPYFVASLFLLATATIHGVGLYSLRRWNLRGTSRVFLVISSLLVPLGILAAIALSEDRPVTDPLYIAAVVAGLAAYSGISFSAGRVLLGRSWWVLFLAVMGPSATQLLISRLAQPGNEITTTMLLFLPPVAAHFVATGVPIWRASLRRRMSQRRVTEMFLGIGVSVFSLLTACGLLVWKTGAIRETLAAVAPCWTLAAATVLGTGLVVQQRVASSKLAGSQTAGTWLALVGAALMGAALLLAWPRPAILVAVGLANFAALTALALRAGFIVLHPGAVASLTTAVLIGFYVWQGQLSWESVPADLELLGLLLQGKSGAIVALVSLLTAVAAAALKRANAALVSTGYIWSTAALGAVSTIIALYAGFFSGVEGELATPVLLVNAAALLMAGARIRRAEFTWLGSGLLLAGLIHALCLNGTSIAFLQRIDAWPRRPMLAAMLWHATITAGWALAVARRRAVTGRDSAEASAPQNLVRPLSYSALVTSAAVVPEVVLNGELSLAWRWGHLLWIASLWGAMAVVRGSQPLLVLAQSLATLAVALATTDVCQRQDWWADAAWDPRHLQAQLAMLAGWCLVWSLARSLCRNFDHGFCRLIAGSADQSTSFDRVLLGGVVLGTAGVVVAGSMPGIAAELSVAAAIQVAWTPARILLLLVVLALCGGALIVSLIAGRPRNAFVTVVAVMSAVAGLTLPAGYRAVNQFWARSGGAHEHVFGPGSWIALTVVLLALLQSFWQRATRPAACGLLISTALIPFLAAGRAESALASASVLRFGLAAYALLTALLAGSGIWRKRFPGPDRMADDSGPQTWLNAALVSLSLPLAAVPVLAITARYAVLLASRQTTAGPIGDSLFARIGPEWSYALPMSGLTAACLVYAVRDQRGIFKLTASWFIQSGVIIWLAVPVWMSPIPVGFAELVQILQGYAFTVAAISLCWLAGRGRFSAPGPELPYAFDRSPSAWDVHVRLLFVTLIGLAGVAALGIVVWPDQLPRSVGVLGRPVSFATIFLAAAVCLWPASRTTDGRLASFGLPVLLSTFCVHVASATAGWNAPQNWLSYHTLVTGWCAVIGVMIGAACVGRRRDISPAGETALGGVSGNAADSTPNAMGDPRPLLPNFREAGRAAVPWIVGLGSLVMILAVPAEWSDPHRPWWSAGWTLYLACCAVVLAVGQRSQTLAYVSTVLSMMAASFVWLRPWFDSSRPVTAQSWLGLIEANLTAAASFGVVWLTIAVVAERRNRNVFDRPTDLPPVHHAAAVLGTGLAAVTAVVCVVGRSMAVGAEGAFPVVSGTGGWIMLAALGLLAAGCLWDSGARLSAGCLYVLGLTAGLAAVDGFALPLRRMALAADCLIAGYVLLTGLLWKERRVILTAAGWCGVPEPERDATAVSRWLPTANLGLAALVIAAGFYVVLTFADSGSRYAGAAAVLALVPALGLLAEGDRRGRFADACLLCGTIAVVDFGWAMMPVRPQPHFWLERSIRLMEILAVMTFVNAVVLTRPFSQRSLWYAASRRVATLVGGGALLSLLCVLAQEAVWFDPHRGAPVTTVQLIVVAAALVGLSTALVRLAILPGRDPLELSQRGRRVYVYAAEAVLLLLFVHLRLTMPELFGQRFVPYWPLFVMALAFFGVGMGEVLRRHSLLVVSEPLQRSGALLSMLPALGFWIHTSHSSYSTVLFLAGLVYVLLSLWRQSFLFAAAAALAGNAALWALFHEAGWTLLSRPQMWLIPPAVSVLAAAQWNRNHLSERQLNGIRYLAVTVIYVSSTGEMFLTGAGESLILPMVLAGLSVAGVFAGILMRIRAFLFVGSSFLLLSIVSMVWHAAQNIGHVWPWWAFGFGLGLSILVLFGLFEKKRKEVLRLLDELRRWEP